MLHIALLYHAFHVANLSNRCSQQLARVGAYNPGIFALNFVIINFPGMRQKHAN